MTAERNVIVAFNDDGPVSGTLVPPLLDVLRKKFLSALAVGASIDRDTDTQSMIAAEMGLDEAAAQFVWAVLDAALRVDPFLRSDLSAQRLDALTRQLAGIMLDTADDIVSTVESLQEHP